MAQWFHDWTFGPKGQRFDTRCLSIQTRIKSAPGVFDSDHCKTFIPKKNPAGVGRVQQLPLIIAGVQIPCTLLVQKQLPSGNGLAA